MPPPPPPPPPPPLQPSDSVRRAWFNKQDSSFGESYRGTGLGDLWRGMFKKDSAKANDNDLNAAMEMSHQQRGMM
jgi:hypothetical protein